MKTKSNVRSHIRRGHRKIILVKKHRRMIEKRKKNYGAVSISALATVDKNTPLGLKLQEQRFTKMLELTRQMKAKGMLAPDMLKDLVKDAENVEYVIPFNWTIDKDIAEKLAMKKTTKGIPKIFEEEFRLLAIGKLKDIGTTAEKIRLGLEDVQFQEPEVGFRAMEKRFETPFFKKFKVIAKTGVASEPGFRQEKGVFRVSDEVRKKTVEQKAPGPKSKPSPLTDVWTMKLDSAISEFNKVAGEQE